MARPQIEHGYAKVANEIAEALAKINLSPYESRIVWSIFRETYGWSKKSERITVSRFQELTGLKRQHISRTLAVLIGRNVIERKGKSHKIYYGFQKDYEIWQEYRISHFKGDETSPHGVMSEAVKEQENSKAEQSPSEKKLKKGSITKEDVNNIYNHWNSLKIIVHDTMTVSMDTAIRNALKQFGKVKIMQAMINYSMLLSGDYEWTYKWTLQDFLNRGKGNNIERFKDMEVLRKNYARRKSENGINRGHTEEGQPKYSEPPPFRE